MSISMQAFNWTTLDELAFVQTIHRSKNTKLLRSYIRIIANTDHGPASVCTSIRTKS